MNKNNNIKKEKQQLYFNKTLTFQVLYIFGILETIALISLGCIYLLGKSFDGIAFGFIGAIVFMLLLALAGMVITLESVIGIFFIIELYKRKIIFKLKGNPLLLFFQVIFVILSIVFFFLAINYFNNFPLFK